MCGFFEKTLDIMQNIKIHYQTKDFSPEEQEKRNLSLFIIISNFFNDLCKFYYKTKCHIKNEHNLSLYEINVML